MLWILSRRQDSLTVVGVYFSLAHQLIISARSLPVVQLPGEGRKSAYKFADWSRRARARNWQAVDKSPLSVSPSSVLLADEWFGQRLRRLWVKALSERRLRLRKLRTSCERRMCATVLHRAVLHCAVARDSLKASFK